jgi:hypothetical protein
VRFRRTGTLAAAEFISAADAKDAKPDRMDA